MNREIKFRGKSYFDGRWIFGDLFHTIGTTGDGLAIQYYDDEDGWMTEDVDENTVGQFTGMCDGAGTEIYEGDLLFCNKYNQFPYRVYWNDKNCCFRAIAKNRNELLLSKEYLYIGFRVIGNTHDNPELRERRPQ